MGNMGHKLTDKEKLVLWGLTGYPGLKDVEVSKKLGIERRTFSAVKTKLKNRGVFSTLTVPDFNALGCKLLTVCYGRFNPMVPYDDRKEGVQKIRECEEIIHVYSTDRKFLLLCASKNFTEFRKKAAEILRFYKQNNFLEDVTHVHFPLEISRYRFFGFSELIKDIFGLDIECENKNENPAERIRLTKNEKKVLCALVEMPDAKNDEITVRTKVSTHVVSRIKKKLFENGIIKLRNIPDLKLLGFELIAFMHIKYKIDKGNEHEHQPAEIFGINSDAESATFCLFKNYTDYEEYYNRKLQYLGENDLIDEEPAVLLFPVQKLKPAKEFSFAPLVKKVLEIDS